ncbi:hypothetical protein HPB52_019015 [Rhipicephalus sanguineus]|uniref:Uncharacterized protein n=1 Tax=Rhipicephalus sanguineus TaxID=34632 RepID=A0A9D4PZW2_RHISA|nr:hypothetical protein HPB52_019015 [Rhipicephalus sanguineus]
MATRRIDIMAYSVGPSPSRCQRFDFATYEFRRATFFVQNKWNRGGLILTGSLSWASLLTLSVLVTAGFFVLLNVRHGHRPFEGISQLILALVAAVLLIASPVRKANEPCTYSRTVIACWLLAGFYLAAFTQSLLTATLSAQPTWDADDTVDKLVPKLRHAKRWARNKHQFTGNINACADRTTKGTHLLITFDKEPCQLSGLAGAAVEGKSSILSVFAGFPIRKYYHLQGPFVSLIRRVFETGWHVRHERFETFNCTAIQDVPAQKLRTNLLVKMYLAVCASIIGVFLLKVLRYRRTAR